MKTLAATEMNGKELSQTIREELKSEVLQLKENGIIPHLTVIIVGDDPASRSYVRGKEKASKETGISSDIIELPSSTTEKNLLEKIEELNNDETVHGILVQLPLPDHINEQEVIESISPTKDVDGFHPINVGKMMTGNSTFLPCTPYGILTMLKAYDVSIEGKHAVIVGRSNIVGKPVGQLLLNENATVTYCHSRTKNLTDFTKEADILILAMGRPNSIHGEHVKDGAVIVDVGINRMADGSLTGDADFPSVAEKASHITPVPRGVGPMTITMLLKNTIMATKGMPAVGK
ncbi:bifunctional methylenetetrahydrofolate dehydrogenase/methenyltetrahydrofolate cyclohydrolase FolD [Lentibacillus cibarius]|uniref:Bifunctional protein FolD n=1 Tax=Lentibacillus cibarius TaxID=2583219 RepID=A0A549YLB4_9BACI|nr:bifunctional methylenetetrahydrofolate dehydrogenase/methenyltetrahydrofolate cyclohydrolase FolD [Lentibacillus cibarius]